MVGQTFEQNAAFPDEVGVLGIRCMDICFVLDVINSSVPRSPVRIDGAQPKTGIGAVELCLLFVAQHNDEERVP
jgi:hypothetical protein